MEPHAIHADQSAGFDYASPTRLSGFLLLLALVLLLSACGTSEETEDDPDNVGTRGSASDAVARDEQGRRMDLDGQAGRGIFMRISSEDLPYSVESYDAFMQARCVDLGEALEALASEDRFKREQAWSTIQRFQDHDEDVRRRAAPNPPSGLVIPRYIAAELNQPKGQRDLAWLSRQGVMLQANYLFESEKQDDWDEGILRLLTLGDTPEDSAQGKRFLAMQMVVRLQSPRLYLRAQRVLAQDVPDEAAPYLVTAAHLQIGAQPNVYSRRAADALALIGESAVDDILTAYHKAGGGVYVPADDNNWRTRRFLSDALGEICDPRATETLSNELMKMQITNESTRLLYTEVVMTSLGKIGDPRGIDAILAAWRRDRDDGPLTTVARQALKRITGRTYRTPEG